jgi:hypothetical protein
MTIGYTAAMRILGRQISNWWLLVVLPLLFVAAPVLLIGFFAANNLAGAILGPPAIWNRPRNSPPREELVGTYMESGRREGQRSGGQRVSLLLSADGSMVVNNLPYEFYPSSCILSGKGTWSGPNGDQRIDLTVTSDQAPGSCSSGSYIGLELTGRSKPYGLYWVIGDPDSGTGVWLIRQR